MGGGGTAEHPEEKHPDEEQVDVELFLQLLERFGGMPFRGGICVLRARAWV